MYVMKYTQKKSLDGSVCVCVYACLYDCNGFEVIIG